uniref:Peroxin-14 n=1 Tax=Angiostrongylus cantonensis TaxID=6313 RepID=A0A0K0D611_ANGCA
MSSLTRLPSLEEMYRKRPSFTRPPVRAVNSPRLTDEEADQLTSPFLNYSTGYTYAFSQAYNPDRPPAWEVGQNGMAAIGMVRSVVFWLLHLITIRLMKGLGLLFYNLIEGILCLIRSIAECISVSLYKVSSYHANHLRSCSSTREVLSLTSSMFFCSIFRILRAPVDLTISAFRLFQTALKRSYYERLEEKANEINKRAVLSKIDEIKRLEVEARRFLAEVQTRRAARARGELVDDYDGGQCR